VAPPQIFCHLLIDGFQPFRPEKFRLWRNEFWPSGEIQVVGRLIKNSEKEEPCRDNGWPRSRYLIFSSTDKQQQRQCDRTVCKKSPNFVKKIAKFCKKIAKFCEINRPIL
jgi:hypothetical protein